MMDEEEVVAEVDEDAMVMIAAVIDPAAIALVEESLHHATHLRPLWERLLVGEEPDEGRTILGMSMSNKVTSDTIENHSRHLFSLFNLLGVPLVSSPMMLQRFNVFRSAMRSLKGPAVRADKKKEKEAAAAAAAALAEAEAEAEAGEGADGADAGDSADAETSESPPEASS